MSSFLRILSHDNLRGNGVHLSGVKDGIDQWMRLDCLLRRALRGTYQVVDRSKDPRTVIGLVQSYVKPVAHHRRDFA